MKLNCADYSSDNPTEEMIFELVRDNARRGEFMILEADDGEAFVQIAGDYDAAHPDARVFTLEYRGAGKDSPLNHAATDVTAAEATEALVSELRGDHAWRTRHPWELVKVGGGLSAGTLIALVVVITAVAGVCKFVLKLF